MANDDITQQYCLLQEADRDEAIIRLFAAQDVEKAIIFCKTKKEVDRLLHLLSQRGHSVKGLHGDMEQPQRETVIASFRANSCKTLIATDVAARGLNIVDVTHVINYHIPFDAENYVHRIGRTGRAGRKGFSITFVTPKEQGRLMQFQRILGAQINRLLLPSKQEIRSLQIQKIVQQIENITPNGDLLAAAESLAKKIDPTTIAAKLLHKILSQDLIEGPDTVGILGAAPAAPVRKFSSDFRGGSRPPINRGRTRRVESDGQGRYPKKKFVHPAAATTGKKRFS